MDADRYAVRWAPAITLLRRALSRTALGALLFAVVLGTVALPAATATPPAVTPAAAPSAGSSAVCRNPDRAGLQQRAPGDLVAFEELAGTGDPAFPPGARAWRVLYVSTGRDNTERTLVCGVVIAPAAGPTVVMGADGQRRGRIVSWSHGTIGLVTRCQPSSDPAARIFGPTPVGLNLVAWSNNANGDGPQGTAADGILAGMVQAGWIVTASDYYADLWNGSTLQPYIMGKIQAANGTDLVRAAHHLLARAGTPTGADSYDVVTWGHSQGGHAALWMGQLLEPYATATATADSPSLSLAGVALEAPASVLVARPGDPDTSLGAGLFDWTAPADAVQLGDQSAIALIFSYIFGAWASYAAGGAPLPDQMPAYPAGGRLDLATVTSPAGLGLVDPIAALCWSETEKVNTLIEPIATTSLLAPALVNGPTIAGVTHGNFDHTCAGNPAPAMAAWCEWSRFNVPGPRGTSPLPKLPKRGEALAPVLIAAGSNDVVVHCVAPASAPDAVPSGSDCVPAALYAALASDYCSDSGAHGHLTLNIWRQVAGVTEAGHDDIPGILATADFETPRFAGSPLQRFITAAFDGTLAAGCTATVVNASGAR